MQIPVTIQQLIQDEDGQLIEYCTGNYTFNSKDELNDFLTSLDPALYRVVNGVTQESSFVGVTDDHTDLKHELDVYIEFLSNRTGREQEIKTLKQLREDFPTWA